jgi:hypothetical protein
MFMFIYIYFYVVYINKTSYNLERREYYFKTCQMARTSDALIVVP